MGSFFSLGHFGIEREPLSDDEIGRLASMCEGDRQFDHLEKSLGLEYPAQRQTIKKIIDLRRNRK